MELTIYNTYVLMESQEQCDRMKQLCIDNNLPIWDYERAFKFKKKYIFGCDDKKDFFILVNNYHMNHTKVTEQEFINLLNKHNEKRETN